MRHVTWYMNPQRTVYIDGYIWGSAGDESSEDGDQSAHQIHSAVWEPSPRPVVLLCPGGGYSFVSDREKLPLAMKWFSQGYNVYILTYSVGPACVYPVPWVEASRAMRFIRYHATAHGNDPHRIAIMGMSAGEHMAAWLSACYEDESLLNYERQAVKEHSFYSEETRAVEFVSNRPDLCILGYPAVDLRVTDGGNIPSDATHRVTPEQIAEHLGYMPGGIICDAQTDSTNKTVLYDKITPGHPPTFIWTTGQDEIVDPAQTLRYAMSLRSQGVICECHMFPYGEHGLSTADRTSCADRVVAHAVGGWLEMAYRFADTVFANALSSQADEV